ncbi:MAG: hypothetical protein KF788_09730 [Piscinibacter sp.]|nr:hypothetical protein [Piscinibacter sp.]
MDTSTRLRLATRIHFALLRQYGEHVEIGSLLKGGADVREAMWVCEASGNAELASMARRLRLGELADGKAATAPSRPAPQEAAWAGDTSGFGVSRPPELEEPAAAAGSSWLRPASWLKRAAAPKHH